MNKVKQQPCKRSQPCGAKQRYTVDQGPHLCKRPKGHKGSHRCSLGSCHHEWKVEAR